MNALLDNLFCKTRGPRWKIAYRLSGMKLLVKGVFLDMMSLKILLNVVFKPVSFNKKKHCSSEKERTTLGVFTSHEAQKYKDCK